MAGLRVKLSYHLVWLTEHFLRSLISASEPNMESIFRAFSFLNSYGMSGACAFGYTAMHACLDPTLLQMSTHTSTQALRRLQRLQSFHVLSLIAYRRLSELTALTAAMSRFHGRPSPCPPYCSNRPVGVASVRGSLARVRHTKRNPCQLNDKLMQRCFVRA